MAPGKIVDAERKRAHLAVCRGPLQAAKVMDQSFGVLVAPIGFFLHQVQNDFRQRAWQRRFAVRHDCFES